MSLVVRLIPILLRILSSFYVYSFVYCCYVTAIYKIRFHSIISLIRRVKTYHDDDDDGDDDEDHDDDDKRKNFK